MRPGDLIQWAFFQGDSQRKFRPALIVTIVPPFNDLLVCAVSFQLQREVKGLDLIIDASHPDHGRMGLHYPSLIRVGQLMPLLNKEVQGVVGSISAHTLELARSRLRKWLESGAV